MDYILEANSTASNQFHGNLVNLEQFQQALLYAVESLRELDRIKKALFYGKPMGVGLPHSDNNCEALPLRLDELIIHGILGAATECGELLEVLEKAFIDSKSVDIVNIKEETGDAFWYFAILAKACNFTFEDAQAANIAKLRLRYPHKFTEFDALNRNLKAERTILEQKEVREIGTSRVFCSICNSLQEYRFDNGDDAINGKPYHDMCCNKCDFLIACFEGHKS